MLIRIVQQQGAGESRRYHGTVIREVTPIPDSNKCYDNQTEAVYRPVYPGLYQPTGAVLQVSKAALRPRKPEGICGGW